MVEIYKAIDAHFHMDIEEIVHATSRRAFDVILLCIQCLDKIKKEYSDNIRTHINILKRMESGEIQGTDEAKAWQKECIDSLQFVDAQIDHVKNRLLNGPLKQIENYHRIRGLNCLQLIESPNVSLFIDTDSKPYVLRVWIPLSSIFWNFGECCKGMPKCSFNIN